MAQEIVFLHFNDVYHVSKRNGIARFMAQLQVYRDRYRDQRPITVFSGDIFSPSVEASLLRGAHMLPILELLEIDIGCFGNHDFDFGDERLSDLAAKTKFPWLLSNVVRGDRYNDETDLLAGAQRFHSVEISGVKVGFFGLAGTPSLTYIRDWLSCSPELPKCTILSPVDTAKECATHLRLHQRCDLVVAVTHMRLDEDVQVSEALSHGSCEERVDLFLGGHDHELLRRFSGESSARCMNATIPDCSFQDNDPVYDQSGKSGVLPEAVGAVRIVKSGTDFDSLSCVRLSVGPAGLTQVAVEQITDLNKITLDAQSIADNAQRIDECLHEVDARLNELGGEPLLHTDVSLEGRGSVIRCSESNLCNMLADMIRAYYDADIALVNSGSVRCDKIINMTTGSDTQPLSVRDLVDILPFNNGLLTKRVTTTALFQALENSFSNAHIDGRYLQLAGLEVVADWALPEGHRVLEVWYSPSPCERGHRRQIYSDDKLEFIVAMDDFVAEGFDGFTCFLEQQTLAIVGTGMTDTQLLLSAANYGNRLCTPDSLVEDGEQARITRARRAIVSRWIDGKGVVAPKVEGRITSKSSFARH